MGSQRQGADEGRVAAQGRVYDVWRKQKRRLYHVADAVGDHGLVLSDAAAEDESFRVDEGADGDSRLSQVIGGAVDQGLGVGVPGTGSVEADNAPRRLRSDFAAYKAPGDRSWASA